MKKNESHFNDLTNPIFGQHRLEIEKYCQVECKTGSEWDQSHWSETISPEIYRQLLGGSAGKHNSHASINLTGLNRDQPAQYYATRPHYRVRPLKVTALVDVKTL